MKKYTSLDVWLGGALILLSMYTAWEARIFPEDSWMIPMLCSFLLFLSSSFTLYSGIRQTIKVRASGENPEREKKFIKDLNDAKLGMISFGFCAAYVLLITVLGFFAATSVFMISYMFFLGMRKWHVLLAVTLGTDLAIYIFFVNQMRVILPTGILM